MTYLDVYKSPQEHRKVISTIIGKKPVAIADNQPRLVIYVPYPSDFDGNMRSDPMGCIATSDPIPTYNQYYSRLWKLQEDVTQFKKNHVVKNLSPLQKKEFEKLKRDVKKEDTVATKAYNTAERSYLCNLFGSCQKFDEIKNLFSKSGFKPQYPSYKWEKEAPTVNDNYANWYKEIHVEGTKKCWKIS